MPKPATKPRNRASAPVPAAPRWFNIQNLAEPGHAEIRLRGYIGAPKQYRDFWTGEMLEDTEAAGTLAEFENALEALGDVTNLQVSIFSQGGDWATGVAIHNLLIRHPANKLCVIDGLCASAATYAAMACEEIRIPSNASMLIHEASGCECGNADDLRAYANNLESISHNIAQLYAARSGRTVDEIRNLMKEDRYLSGQECADLGLADTVIEPLANLAARAGSLQPTNAAALRHAPAEILALFDMRGLANLSRHQTTPTMKPATTPANQVIPPPAPVAAPAPAAPTPAPTAEPEPAPAPAPVNVVTPPPAPDIAAIVTNAVNTAVTAAVAPLQTKITDLENRLAQGVTAQNLGGAQPTGDVQPVSGPAKPDFENMSAAQLINLGRKNLAAARQPVTA